MKIVSVLFIAASLASCGGGGGGSPAPESSAPPSVELSVDTAKIFRGNSIKLNWSSSNASSCSASGDWSGTVTLEGSETLILADAGAYNFSLNCSGAISSHSVTVTDYDFEGTCINPHDSQFPREYLGEYPMPDPQNYFDDTLIKAIGLKDYGISWIYNAYKNNSPLLLQDCTEEQYVKLMYRETLRRLKSIGVTSVWVANFGYWNNDPEIWTVDHSTKHIKDWEIAFIADTARALDINLHYSWQFNMRIANSEDLLFPFNGTAYVDMSLLTRIMAAHEKHIIWEAQRLEGLGFKSMSADWQAMWLAFCGLDCTATESEIADLKDFYMQRMGQIIAGIRQSFSGEVFVGEGIQWNDERVVDQVDGIVVNFPNLIADDEIETANVALIEERATEYIADFHQDYYCQSSQPCWERTSFSNEKHRIIFNLFAQSHASFLSRGWVEDGFCIDELFGQPSDTGCIQRQIKTDFSAQAIWFEGVLRAINNQPYFDLKGATSTTGYWLSDTLLGDGDIEAFPNLSQSIRGKPTEKIIQYWYSGEYQPYAAEFSD